MAENAFGVVSTRNESETRHAVTGNIRGKCSRPVRLRLRQAIALPVYAIGLLLDYLRDARDQRRLRALERICLEQARLCNLPEARAAFEEVARNYRRAAGDASPG
jgi:hypothetical protein